MVDSVFFFYVSSHLDLAVRKYWEKERANFNRVCVKKRKTLYTAVVGVFSFFFFVVE